MARLPYLDLLKADVELPRTWSGFWRTILVFDAKGPWTATDICNASNVNPGTPRKYIRRLVAAGFAERVGERMTEGKNPQPAPLYRLTSRPTEAPRIGADNKPLREHVRDTLWRTIKMAKTFSIDELASLAADADRPINRNTTQAYLNELSRVGIILKLPPSADRRTRYRLVRNLGHHAPRRLHGKIVYDPNAGEVVGAVATSEIAR